MEPRYNEGRAKGLAKFVRYNEVSLYIVSRFFFIYFTITGIKKTLPSVHLIEVCKNRAMFVNDFHSAVTLYCDKVPCC